MSEEFHDEGNCYRCGRKTNIRCDSCRTFMCKDHMVVYQDPQAYHNERDYCFPCARKKAGPKKEGCFIATAAYGTEFCNELDILRGFRDNSLKQFRLGRFFIKFYYATSPYIANVIAKSSVLRWFVRACLKPVVRILKR